MAALLEPTNGTFCDLCGVDEGYRDCVLFAGGNELPER